jgi:hypothetical protein
VVYLHLPFGRHSDRAVTVAFGQTPESLRNNARSEFVPTCCVRIATSDRTKGGALSAGVAVIYDKARKGRREAVRRITILWVAAVALTLDSALGSGLTVSYGSASGV